MSQNKEDLLLFLKRAADVVEAKPTLANFKAFYTIKRNLWHQLDNSDDSDESIYNEIGSLVARVNLRMASYDFEASDSIVEEADKSMLLTNNDLLMTIIGKLTALRKTANNIEADQRPNKYDVFGKQALELFALIEQDGVDDQYRKDVKDEIENFNSKVNIPYLLDKLKIKVDEILKEPTLENYNNFNDTKTGLLSIVDALTEEDAEVKEKVYNQILEENNRVAVKFKDNDDLKSKITKEVNAILEKLQPSLQSDSLVKCWADIESTKNEFFEELKTAVDESNTAKLLQAFNGDYKKILGQYERPIIAQHGNVVYNGFRKALESLCSLIYSLTKWDADPEFKAYDTTVTLRIHTELPGLKPESINSPATFFSSKAKKDVKKAEESIEDLANKHPKINPK